MGKKLVVLDLFCGTKSVASAFEAREHQVYTVDWDKRFEPPCKRGAPCHDAAPRGARTGTQSLKNRIEKAKIPTMLCNHIVDICESHGGDE